MQAPASHLYHAQSINRSCSYLETSSIVIMKRYQGPGPLDIISHVISDCPAATFAQVQRHSSEMTWWQDVMVWLSWCHVIWSHRGSWTRQIYLLSPTIVSDDSMISLFLFHHLLRSRHLTSVQSTLVSDLDPLLSAGHSQAANCQPCVPVDLSTLCPAAAISHPKKPLLLPPPSALACSIQQSGPLSVV